MKGAVVFAIRSGEEVGNAHIDPNYRRICRSLNRNTLIIRKCEPPHSLTLIELDTRIDGFPFEHLAMIVSQFDRHEQELAKGKRADLEPVVKGGILGGLEPDHIHIGL